MGEPQKDTRASADSEKRSALLGQEIDEDFLNSWKPAKVAENALDFKCDTPPSKKKGFKFEKLDMDFSLDGDFNKIASFKLDMPDLDFSSPPRNIQKPKERISNEKNPGRQEGKRDLFTLDFNFNESDSFDLDMGFTKREKKPSTGNDSDKNNCCLQDGETKNFRKKLTSKINSSDVSDLEMASELKTGTIFECEHAAETSGNPEQVNGAHLSGTTSMDIPVMYKELASPGKENNGNSPQNSSSTTVRSTGQSELRGCTGPHVQNEVPELSAKSVSEDDHVQMTASEVQSQSVEVNTSADMKGDNSTKLTDSETSSNASASSLKYPHLQMKHQPDSDTENKQMVASGNLLMKEHSQGSDAVEGADNMNVLGKLNIMVDNQQKHDSLPVVILSPLKRRIVSMKEKASGLTQSKLHNKSEDVQSQHLSASSKNSSGLLGKLTMNKGLADVKCLKSEGCVAQAGTIHTGILKVSKGSAGRRIQVALTREQNINDRATSDSQVCPNNTSEKKVASGLTKDAYSRIVTPNVADAQNSKTISIVAPSLKLNISPFSGINKVCNTASPEISRLVSLKSSETDTAVRKEGTALKYSGVRMQMNLASKVKNIIGGDELAVVSPSLKRKNLEVTNSETAILNPLKRPTGSSCGSRVVHTASVMAEKKKILVIDEDLEENFEKVCLAHQAATPDDLDANKTNIVPLLIENDGHVEKAEACSKELEDLCNMLKKKHDEAKEILVRAIVNNNSLLMLNHPIYDEKIQKLQRHVSDMVLKDCSF